MLLRDEFHRAPQDLQMVDIGGIGAGRRGEGLLLGARPLVGGIEQGGDLRIVREHALVKVLRQGFSLLLEDGSRGFDDVDGPLGQHTMLLVKIDSVVQRVTSGTTWTLALEQDDRRFQPGVTSV
jgi:hypothetical protein